MNISGLQKYSKVFNEFNKTISDSRILTILCLDSRCLCESNHCRYRRLTRSDTGNSEHDLHRVCTESAPSHLCNSICSKASIPRSSGYRRKVANQVASVEFDEYIRIRMSSKCQVNVKLADIHQHLTIESLWGHVVSEERSFAFLPSSFPLPLAGPHEYHKAKSRPSRNIFDLAKVEAPTIGLRCVLS